MRTDKLRVHQEVCLLRNETEKVKRINRKSECSLCNKTFVTTSSLRRHVTKRHKVTNNDGSFMLVSKIISKYKSIKKNAIEYICKMCPVLRRFKTRFNLNRHSHKFHKENRDKIQIGSSFLKLSPKEIEDRKVSCNICKEVFTCIQNLDKHQQDFHGVIKSYSCNLCFKHFNKKNGLIDHNYEVHRERNYDCFYCEKSFKRRGNLISHKYRVHYSCKKLKSAKQLSRSQLYI